LQIQALQMYYMNADSIVIYRRQFELKFLKTTKKPLKSIFLFS